MENVLGRDIYEVTDLEKLKITRQFDKIDRFFQKAIIIGLLSICVTLLGTISYHAGRMHRPLSYVYYFIPVEKKNSAIILLSSKDLRFIKPDSIKSLLMGKPK